MSLVFDHMVESVEHVNALAKALVACVVIRGAQLSIVRRLDSRYVIEMHTKLISWIVRRIAGYETAKNKKERAKAISFFKALYHLLTAIDSRDASEMCESQSLCSFGPFC